MKPPRTVTAGLLALLALSAGCDVVAPLARRFGAKRGSPPPPALPIPSAPTSPTTHGDDARLAEWDRRSMLEAYERVGLKDPRWDAAALRFVEASFPGFLGSTDTKPAELAAQGKALRDLGCADPLVLYFDALNLYLSQPDSAEAPILFTRAVEGMKTTKYPRAVARFVASGLYRAYERSDEGIGLRRLLAPLELQWFRQSLADESYGPDDDEVLVRQLTQGSGEGFFKRNKVAATAALRGLPWLDEWAKRLLAGIMHRHLAWSARGGGFAGEVKPEAWETFKRESGLAREDLVAAWELRPDRPEAAYWMITVSEDAPAEGETARTWFDRTLAAQMDYGPAYTALLNRRLPRWGGSYEQMLEIGKEAVASGRFDTGVPLILLDAVNQIAEDQKDEAGGAGEAPVYERAEVPRLLDAMLDRYLAQPSRSDHDLFRSYKVCVADRSGRLGEARDQLIALGFRLHPRVEWCLGEPPESFITRVATLGGPAAEGATKGEALRLAGDEAGALAAFRSAKATDSLAQTQQYLGHRMAGLALEEKLALGGFAPFLPTTPDLAGWEARLGHFTVEGTSLVATNGTRGFLLVSTARVGPDFEIRGRIELLGSSNGEYQGGIVFGHPRWETRDWISFRLKRNHREGNVAYFSQHLFHAWIAPEPLEVSEVCDVVVRCSAGRLTASVNGRTVAREIVPPKGLATTADVQVGFGGYLDENLFSMRFRNFELRRLPAGAAGVSVP